MHFLQTEGERFIPNLFVISCEQLIANTLREIFKGNFISFSHRYGDETYTAFHLIPLLYRPGSISRPFPNESFVDREKRLGVTKRNETRAINGDAFTVVLRTRGRESKETVDKSVARATSLSTGCLDHRITSAPFRRVHDTQGIVDRLGIVRKCSRTIYRLFVVYRVEN